MCLAVNTDCSMACHCKGPVNTNAHHIVGHGCCCQGYVLESRALDRPACSAIKQCGWFAVLGITVLKTDSTDCMSCTAAAVVVFVLMVAAIGALVYYRRRRQQGRKYGSPKKQLALPDVETGICVTPAQSCHVMSLRDRYETAGCAATLHIP